MKTSLKTGFAQIKFSCCPPKMGGYRKFEGGGLPRSYAPLSETKKDKLFFKQLRSSYLFGWEKIYPFPELVKDKPDHLPSASEVCHARRASKPP